MEAYPLGPLLSVRHYREENAKRGVRDAETALRNAEAEVEKKKAELTAFRQWRHEEEERRYASIMLVPMNIQELDEFKAGLAALADNERKKEEDIRLAEKACDGCRSQLDKARTLARQAQKNTAKIQAHEDIWIQDAKKEAEHKEDLELEEFRPISRKGAEAEGEDA